MNDAQLLLIDLRESLPSDRNLGSLVDNAGFSDAVVKKDEGP